jgi:PST family polysaccharide transporter
MITYLKESIPIFISNVSIKIYVSSNKVIIGSFLSMTEVAYYDLAEKIVNLLRTPQGILSQTIFPKISKEKNKTFTRKIFWISLLVNLILFLGTFIFSKYIILVLGGKQMIQAIWVVNILAFTVPIVAMSNIMGVQMLIPWGFQKVFSRVIILSGIVYLFLLSFVWLFLDFNIYTISIVTVLTEIFVTSAMFLLCKKYSLWK